MFIALHREIVRKLRQVGLYGTLRHIAKIVPHELRKLGPSYRRFMYEERSFDRKYGMETSKKVRVGAMGIADDDLVQTYGYQASPVALFKQIMHDLPISYQDYILIDFGSGKGRTLLLASDIPFKKIIGIELSYHLNEIARKNIRIYRSRLQKCHDLVSLCVNAREFEIPDEKAVFYFYNPFGEEVMRTVLSNIGASIKRCPRQIWLVYAHPLHHELTDQAGFLQIIKKEKDYLIYANNNSS